MNEWTIPVSMLIALGGFLLSYLSNRRNMKNDASNEGKSNGTVLTELGYIKRALDELTRKVDEQNAKHNELAQMVYGIKLEMNELKTKVNANAEKNSRDHGTFYTMQKEFEKCQTANAGKTKT